MKIKQGNLFNRFNAVSDILFITTNSIVRNDKLIMGKGIAQTARAIWPKLPAQWGYHINQGVGSGGRYGLIAPAGTDAPSVGAFQTKTQVHLSSKISYIEQATRMLVEFADLNPHRTIHLPFPGIGAGKLHWMDVYRVIDRLPMNVTVWTLERQEGIPYSRLQA